MTRPLLGIIGAVESTLPLLLIDVDGPLNPYEAIGCPQGYTEHPYTPPWLSHSDAPPTVRLNPDHGAALQALPYELIWCTTWGQEANEFIAPRIGLPPLRVLPLGQEKSRPDNTLWKTWDVVRWCRDLPFAWVDDMLTKDDTVYVNGTHNAPFLLLPVSPLTGLSPTDFEMLQAWAQDLP